ncbi:TolC family protein [Pedobacter sp. MR2016-19]|uniref:TolC family protein n=1 Tax=Pedobacter sp. MR2016-19 TaxID=2780089 RepID=UPI001873886F|nr:TolC family protein [Pedobacter sp. MR2016-19]MBE5321591.1 TolC family protein [Pedobacter sp. MR2016-19]
MRGKFLFMGLLIVVTLKGFAFPKTDTLQFTLQQVVEMAKANSIAAKQAITVKETKYWEWRTFKSNYQPQLALEGILPGYTKTYTQVQQPNGSILFQPVHYDNSSLTLNFSQSIAATGGTVYGTTQLQRFDDFDRNSVLYNGIPYGIGYTQPLLQFNSLKWDKKIEPLKFNESKQVFIETQEKIAITVTEYFFDLLLAQVNLNIADLNYGNTRRILTIAGTKFELGKISKNEMLQLQLEVLNAQKAVGTAKRDVEIATLNLRSYIGMEGDDRIKLQMPAVVAQMTVITEKVLAEAFENRSDAIGFIRRLAEAKRDVAKAKGENGLVATLNANLGFSNAANSAFDIYRSPKNQQSVELKLSIPVMDWGRSKSRTKTAQANEQFITYAVEQDKQTFKQQIVTQVTLFNMMKEQILLTDQAENIAAEKYKIASERYVLGNLSITDLSIAFQENDRAKRDYVSSLRDFWGAYYQLRYLSLYDFEKNRKITY